jgi:hypothetical protein
MSTKWVGWCWFENQWTRASRAATAEGAARRLEHHRRILGLDCHEVALVAGDSRPDFEPGDRLPDHFGLSRRRRRDPGVLQDAADDD